MKIYTYISSTCFFSYCYSLGRPGWGIAWYINDELIPIITVKRGVTYTFDIYGGDDDRLPASYHPFYITDDPDGGYAQLSPQEQQVEIPPCIFFYKQYFEMSKDIHPKVIKL